MITQLKEEEKKSRSRSFYKTTSNINTTRKNENSKSVSMSHLNTSSIKTKMYVPGEKLKQSKNKIKLLSSQPLTHNNNKNNNEQINNSLKHLEYNYENLMALSLKGMNSIQAKPKQSSNINNK